MAIIQTGTPAAPTHDELVAATVKRITANINSLLKAMLNTYNQSMTMVWANQNGIDAQDILNGFGTDAGELFRLAGILSTAVNAATPNAIPASTANVTINSDGTVTVQG